MTHLTALEQQREDQALGAAWRRCEAARSMWEAISLLSDSLQDGTAVLTNRGSVLIAFHKDTPTAALEALADALEARTAE